MNSPLEALDPDDSEAMEEAADAGLHVHHHPDGAVDIIVARDNVHMGLEVQRADLDLIVHAVRARAEAVTVGCGRGRIEIMDVDDEEDGLVMIGVSSSGWDSVLWAARTRSVLAKLLTGGCESESDAGVPQKSDCGSN